MTRKRFQCTICLSIVKRNKLIAPCHCKGHQRYVHKHCIEAWIVSSGKPWCPVCLHPLQTTEQHLPIINNNNNINVGDDLELWRSTTYLIRTMALIGLILPMFIVCDVHNNPLLYVLPIPIDSPTWVLWSILVAIVTLNGIIVTTIMNL